MSQESAHCGLMQNGRDLTIGYGTSGGITDAASRVDGLIDGATTLVNYAYLGLGTTVQTTYPQPALQYTLIGVSGGTSVGEAGTRHFGWCSTPMFVECDLKRRQGDGILSNQPWKQLSGRSPTQASRVQAGVVAV